MFKSSDLPQAEELKKYLQSVLTDDAFNKFCIDCQLKQSTHALLAYGIFVCKDCANEHIKVFHGKGRSQVKEIFTEQWDDMQLEAIAPGVGGNKLLFNYMQDYEGLAQQQIEKRYTTSQLGWYARKLQAHLEQRPFSDIPPAKDWDERFSRAKTTMKSIFSIGGDKKNQGSDDSASNKSQEASSDLSAPQTAIQKSDLTSSEQPKEEQKSNEQGAQDKNKWNKFKGFFKGKFSSKDKGSSNENPPTQAKKEVVEAPTAEHQMEL